jgi:hypothetical protein
LTLSMTGDYLSNWTRGPPCLTGPTACSHRPSPTPRLREAGRPPRLREAGRPSCTGPGEWTLNTHAATHPLALFQCWEVSHIGKEKEHIPLWHWECFPASQACNLLLLIECSHAWLWLNRWYRWYPWEARSRVWSLSGSRAEMESCWPTTSLQVLMAAPVVFSHDHFVFGKYC